MYQNSGFCTNILLKNYIILNNVLSNMILLAGANGFIGQAFLRAYPEKVIPLSLRKDDWQTVIRQVKPEVIIHLSGISGNHASKMEIYSANVQSLHSISSFASKNNVKKFIFLSSTHAELDNSYNYENPNEKNQSLNHGYYVETKKEGENILFKISNESEMKIVIIRSPLVYGPGVKANFQLLFRLVDLALPVPLASLDKNKRSFVAISNLVSLLNTCVYHPAAKNQIFNVSDEDDISTAELLRRIGKALAKPLTNIKIPTALLKLGLRLAGKKEWIEKIFGNQRVYIERTKKTLGWKPKVTMEEELVRTAKWWRSQARD